MSKKSYLQNCFVSPWYAEKPSKIFPFGGREENVFHVNIVVSQGSYAPHLHTPKKQSLIVLNGMCEDVFTCVSPFPVPPDMLASSADFPTPVFADFCGDFR